jgi:hypothetical protein
MNTIGSTWLLVALAAAPGGGPATSPGANPAARTAPNDQPAPPKKSPRGKFTVSKETTFVTGPVDADGFIDYPAALNDRLGQGVTAETNANVLIWRALGPHPEGATMPAEFFRLLGIDPPPEQGDYFIDIGRYAQDQLKLGPGPATQEFLDRLQGATRRPWTAQEDPQLAGWLKANQKPLAVVAEATRRPHYFSPLVPPRTEKGSAGLIGALLPAVQKCRGLASALAARAMLRTGQGEADAAWQDLLACHRLGRLVGRGGTLIEGLVGIALDAITARADLAFLDRTQPDAKHLDGYLRDLQGLPPLPAAADKVALGERFMFLDSVMMIDRHGLKYLNGLADGKSGDDNLAVRRALEGINWDPAMRNGNRWYDRMTAAMRLPDRASREKKLDEIEKELKDLKAAATANQAAEFVGGPDGRGKVIGDILIGLLLPAVRKVQTADDRSHQTQDNLQLAIALARYQRDRGGYPKELGELVPRYLARVPGDVFSGGALVYRPAGNGYLLYSVGPNGKDDDGRGPDDQPPGDDLFVRMPVPVPK